MPSSTQLAQSGDLAYLVGPRGQTFTIQLKSGEQLHSMHGILSHDALIGVVWGSQVETHLSKRFTLLQPALDDLLRDIERNTQVVIPKTSVTSCLTWGSAQAARCWKLAPGPVR